MASSASNCVHGDFKVAPPSMKKRKAREVTMISAEDPGWRPSHNVRVEPSSAKRTRFAKRTAPDLPAVTEAEVSDVNDTDLSYAKSMFEWCSGQLDKLGRKTGHEWDVQKKRLQDHQSLKMTLFFRVKDIQAELVNASVTLKKLQTELQGDFEIKDGMLTQYNAVAESITKHTKEKLDFELKIIQTKQEIKNMKDDLEKIEENGR